jgi:hypothetical protein
LLVGGRLWDRGEEPSPSSSLMESFIIPPFAPWKLTTRPATFHTPGGVIARRGLEIGLYATAG